MDQNGPRMDQNGIRQNAVCINDKSTMHTPSGMFLSHRGVHRVLKMTWQWVSWIHGPWIKSHDLAVIFLFSSFILLETNDCKYRLYLWYRRKGEVWKTGNDENRPNNVRHIVWALGKSFLLFPSYYLILINILLHIQVVIYKLHETERDQMCLELQVNCYHLTPKLSTGKAGAWDAIRLKHR